MVDGQRLLIRLQAKHGNKWKKIATEVPSRTAKRLGKWWEVFKEKQREIETAGGRRPARREEGAVAARELRRSLSRRGKVGRRAAPPPHGSSCSALDVAHRHQRRTVSNAPSPPSITLSLPPRSRAPSESAAAEMARRRSSSPAAPGMVADAPRAAAELSESAGAG
ncbi:hypothetical protein ZWY2020_022094 [Hordeum vulgare]|nr:hypothetical protein ZWY2020_022094 [Hordeum vulgare]